MLQRAASQAIKVRQLKVRLGERDVIHDLSMTVERGEIIGLVGASGGGKTVLLRTMLGLLPKTSGTVDIMGIRLESATPEETRRIGRQCGMMFQQGALFSSLTLRENVEFPMREYLDGPDEMFREVALAKLEMVGLSPDDAEKLPAEISGGMTKRVAIARALALDPELLLLDEPTSGLDPIAASEIDRLIRALHRTLSLTVLMVTHDLSSLKTVATRIIALYGGAIIAQGTMQEMLEADHPWLKAYFQGERGRAAQTI
jgi:phospholipid/cholesterol/gamma-HCH transport system ATP-binding protein